MHYISLFCFDTPVVLVDPRVTGRKAADVTTSSPPAHPEILRTDLLFSAVCDVANTQSRHARHSTAQHGTARHGAMF